MPGKIYTPEQIIRKLRENVSEFTAKAVLGWLMRPGVKTLYFEPGSPWENGYIESL